MKKLILTLIVIALSLGATATAASAASKSAESLDAIFSEFSKVGNASTVKISPFLMWVGKMFAGDDPDAKELKKIKSLRVLSLEGCDPATKARFRERLSNLSLNGYEEMVRVNSDGDRVLILVKTDKKGETIRKMAIMADDGEDCVLVEVNGKFRMDDIAGIVDSQTLKRNGRN